MSPAELKQINAEFRKSDDSSLWPIRGRFSVANRAIKQAYQFRADYGPMSVEEYKALLEQLASEIVNNPANW